MQIESLLTPSAFPWAWIICRGACSENQGGSRNGSSLVKDDVPLAAALDP
jgi:hypothetical protein